MAGWEHDNRGRQQHLGPIQRSGLVRLGDRLVRINGKDVTDWTFREVMDALKELVSSTSSSNNSSSVPNSNSSSRRRLKTLGFAPAGTAEWSKGTYQPSSTDSSFFTGLLYNNPLMQLYGGNSDGLPAEHVVHTKRQYSFVSFVGRWRVAQHGGNSAESSFPSNENMNIGEDVVISEQQERQFSENSNELERELNKEPSIRYDNNNDNVDPSMPLSLPQEETTHAVDTTNEKLSAFIQYEIQCHILFRDQSSFQSPLTSSNLYGNNTTTNSNNANNVHHTWSVWKRYSEFAALHETLRQDFGWQIENSGEDGNESIDFPSPHDVESWWYGLRNGGGVVTRILGDSSGGTTNEDQVGVGDVKANGHGNTTEESSSWGSSLYGLFRTSSTESNTNKNAQSFYNTKTTNDDNEQNTADNSQQPNCPFPTAFIEKRQKELSVYWTKLMKIEDIFEFSDVHSHKYGKVMSSFLEVDKVLLAKSNSSQGGEGSIASYNHHVPAAKSHAFPAINENETTEMFGSFDPSSAALGHTTTATSIGATREALSGIIHDDDVSILSDGTGAFGGGDASAYYVNSRTPLRGTPLVDIVPGNCNNDGSPALIATNGAQSGGDMNGANGAPAPAYQQPKSSSSVSSRKSRQSRKGRAAPRAKPAFQRVNMMP